MSSESSNAEGPAKFWADLSSQSMASMDECNRCVQWKVHDNQQE